MERVAAVVIGAGVVGLAIARVLARSGRETLLLESAEAIGSQTSSRNSEVIHAGIYYPAGSLKAQLCRCGRDLLYAYCETSAVPHRRCGKLLVATSANQVAVLKAMLTPARANGVQDLMWLDRGDVTAMEPALSAVAGLFSPSTGIVDSHALMLALLADFERAGGTLVLRSPVVGLVCTAAGHRIQIGGAEPIEIGAGMVVNATGLWAPELARRAKGLDPGFVPSMHLAKGSYFSLSGRAPFSRLVYPLPEPGGLGIHFTLDLAGQGRFGPDVEWLPGSSPGDVDYSVGLQRRDAFAAAIKRYWPALPVDALQPAYSGVRPKLSGPGEPAGDFMLQGPQHHGINGLLNLFGIESPGLTASLAIAEESLRRLAR